MCFWVSHLRSYRRDECDDCDDLNKIMATTDCVILIQSDLSSEDGQWRQAAGDFPRCYRESKSPARCRRYDCIPLQSAETTASIEWLKSVLPSRYGCQYVSSTR